MTSGHVDGSGDSDGANDRSFLEPMPTPAPSKRASTAASAAASAAVSVEGAPPPIEGSNTDQGRGVTAREAVLLVLDGQLQALSWESLPSLEQQRCAPLLFVWDGTMWALPTS